jgi:RND family efflux transporter MFP subunit
MTGQKSAYSKKRGAAAALMMIFAGLAGCSSQGSPDGQSSAPAALVKTAQAVVAPVETKLRLYGAADGGTAANRDLAPLAESVLISIDTPVGTRVRRGAVIARLRPSPASSLDLLRARTDSSAAQNQLARMQRLRRDGLASNADVESARLAYDSAQATASSLNMRHGSLVLTAPFEGIVSTIAASPGDIIAAGATVATLVPASATRAKFGIDPEEARLVRAGGTLSVLDANGNVKFAVPIQAVDPGVDPTTRLAAIYAMLPGGVSIGSGEALIGEVTIQSATALPAIPYSAVLSDAGQPYTFVVNNGVAKRVNLILGATSKEFAAVISGIKAGDSVVTDGGTALDDGMKVRLK